ncbi:MAG: tyrosine-type recombinase/integrase [Legionellales bacterium]|nr:tyrosine-type recombinase/integrase [Legionellales bacterium]
MLSKHYVPVPVFDTIDEVIEQYKSCYSHDKPKEHISKWLRYCFSNCDIVVPQFAAKDYQLSLNFLYSYRGSRDTFVSYRRELERLLQWSWFIRKQSILLHKREDIEAFVEFCLKPNKRWIGLKNVARFKLINDKKVPNTEWRPFTVNISKRDRQMGIEPKKNNYRLSPYTLKIMFGILSSFYSFLLQEEEISANPVGLIRQKSKFIRKELKSSVIRRLSEHQWKTVINIAKKKAEIDISHERAVFILSCLYGMYLRISELVSKDSWTPTMGDFSKDSDENWWFKTVGKGNKARLIAVSDDMLRALKHYRKRYLNLSLYPLPNERTPLVGHSRNNNISLVSTRPIRKLVQEYFDLAAEEIAKTDPNEAEALRVATVHWLRHTGISDDVKRRPREHVRDDAGHSSSAITDKYIDIQLRERARSAKKKKIVD